LTVSFGQTPYTYRWSNGATSKDLVNVSAGNYRVTVSDASGNTTVVNATVNGSEPLFVTAGRDQIIGCQDPIVTLDGSNSPSGFAYRYNWTSLEGNLYGNVRKSTLAVSEPGTYILTVKNSDTGCQGKDTVMVTEDFSTPVVQLTADDMTCDRPYSTIRVNAQTEIEKYEWTGPAGFISNRMSPLADRVGTYTLVATGKNGCTVEKQIEIKGNTERPTLKVDGRQLTCNNPVTTLVAESDQAVSYQWTGPNNFSAKVANPETNIPGTYTVQIETAGGCTNQATVTIETAVDAPDLRVEGGTLTCSEATIQIGAMASLPATYEWSGPDGFRSDVANPMVSVAGIYTVKAVSYTHLTLPTILRVYILRVHCILHKNTIFHLHLTSPVALCIHTNTHPPAPSD